MPEPVENLKQEGPSRGIQKLLFNEKYSDLTIECQKRIWKAHRAVLCSQSTYFETACDSKFAESKSGVFKLDDDDPEVVNCMLQFLYKGVYNGLMPGLAKPDEHLMLDVKVYAIADKFGISELKDCAKGKFESHATDAWNSECFSQVVRAVYEMTNETDEDLRSIAIKIAGANASDLMDRGEFKELLKGNNEFAVAVLEQVVQRGTPLNPYTKPTVRPHTEPVKKPLERARHVTSEICANCVASHEWGTPPADFCSCCGGRLESKWH